MSFIGILIHYHVATAINKLVDIMKISLNSKAELTKPYNGVIIDSLYLQ